MRTDPSGLFQGNPADFRPPTRPAPARGGTGGAAGEYAAVAGIGLQAVPAIARVGCGVSYLLSGAASAVLGAGSGEYGGIQSSGVPCVATASYNPTGNDVVPANKDIQRCEALKEKIKKARRKIDRINRDIANNGRGRPPLPQYGPRSNSPNAASVNGHHRLLNKHWSQIEKWLDEYIEKGCGPIDATY